MTRESSWLTVKSTAIPFSELLHTLVLFTAGLILVCGTIAGHSDNTKTLARIGLLTYLAKSKLQLLSWQLLPGYSKRPTVECTNIGAFYLPTYQVDLFATVDIKSVLVAVQAAASISYGSSGLPRENV